MSTFFFLSLDPKLMIEWFIPCSFFINWRYLSSLKGYPCFLLANFFTFFVWTRNTKTIKSNELGAYKSCANIWHIYIKDSLNLKHWISFIVWINIYFFLRSTWLGLMHVINLKVYDYLIKKKYILIWTMKLN